MNVFEQYQQDLQQLLESISRKNPDRLVYLGKSAKLMGEDLKNLAIRCNNQLPVATGLETPKSYLDPSYEKQLGNLDFKGRVAIVEDYAMTGTKLWALSEFLPPNVLMLLLVSSDFARNIPGRVDVIDKNNGALASWLEQRSHPDRFR